MIDNEKAMKDPENAIKDHEKATQDHNMLQKALISNEKSKEIIQVFLFNLENFHSRTFFGTFVTFF